MKEQSITVATNKGSSIHRYKYLVGKSIGGKIYVHKDYAEEVIPHEIVAHGVKHLPETFSYNCIAWEKRSGIIRFDAATGFDSQREPVVGKYIAVLPDGSLRHGESPYIWHHKWLWVQDDYAGFDVQESIDWSREWLSQLDDSANGTGEGWRRQLQEVGLE